VITGYYGMNVRIYPAAGTEAGGMVAILIMIAAVVGLYAMFKKQDWL
jgi:Mg2+ and Co2+ transporter CorA